MLPDRFLMAAGGLRENMRETDRPCSTFGRRVLEQVYGSNVVARAPISMWSVFPPKDGNTDPWSSVTACQRAGIARAVTYPPNGVVLAVGSWHDVQGWDTPFLAGGHNFLWLALTADTGIRLDSAEARYRPAPGPEVHLERWADVKARYTAGVAVAVLVPPESVAR